MLRAGGNCRGFRMRQGGNNHTTSLLSSIQPAPSCFIPELNYCALLLSGFNPDPPEKLCCSPELHLRLINSAKKLCVSLILDPRMGVAKGGAVVCLIVPSVESFYTSVRSFKIQSQQTSWCVYSRREAESKSQGSRVSEATARILSLLC